MLSVFSMANTRERWWLVVGALMLMAAGVRVWHITADRRSPDQKRGEMYQRTLDSVRSVCIEPKPDLESYCRDQATILLEYPECDAACIALARKIRGEPTR